MYNKYLGAAAMHDLQRVKTKLLYILFKIWPSINPLAVNKVATPF